MTFNGSLPPVGRAFNGQPPVPVQGGRAAGFQSYGHTQPGQPYQNVTGYQLPPPGPVYAPSAPPQPPHPQAQYQQPPPQQTAPHLPRPASFHGNATETTAATTGYRAYDATSVQRAPSTQYIQPQQTYIQPPSHPAPAPAPLPEPAPTVAAAPVRTPSYHQPSPSQANRQLSASASPQFAPKTMSGSTNPPQGSPRGMGISVNIPLKPSAALQAGKRMSSGGIKKSPGVSKSPGISRSPALSKSPALKSATRSPTVPPHLSMDHPSILIHVADELLEAAQRGSQRLAASGSPDALKEYQRLVATGLACLDAAISSNKLPPHVEAKARFRYAAIVVDETEDLMVAETMLTKGISLCEKHIFVDLKMCMQYLLVKVLLRRNHKAAMVTLDKTIRDCDTYKHVHWSYAFRFLKATVFMQSLASSEMQSSLQALADIAKFAGSRGDRVIYVFASLLEGLVHLKSDKADSIVAVQTCIAQASKYQFEDSVHLAQIDFLALLLDLSCSLREKRPESARVKMKNLSKRLEDLSDQDGWDSSELLLPLSKPSSPTVSKDASAIVRIGEQDQDFIVLNFMSRSDAFSLAYGLMGIALLFNVGYTDRGIGSWEESLDTLDKISTRPLPPHAQISLQHAIRSCKWQTELRCYVYVLLGLCAGTQSEWARVQKYVKQIESLMDESIDPSLQDLGLYLKGLCYQGRGKLDDALKILGDERFAIQKKQESGPDGKQPTARELPLMAALNRLWIMQDPAHKDDQKAMQILDDLQPLCEDHPDPDIKTVFNLVMASIILYPERTINQVKRYIQSGLHWSQQNCNTQCLSIALNIMRWRLFEGVVGEQALKSAKAASAQAKKVRNLLWMSVAEGMLASSFEMQGHREEYLKCHADAVQYANEALVKSEERP